MERRRGGTEERDERERSGTDGEGGVIFVVGATTGGAENWRV